jgi:hypothetical protein
VGDGLVGVDAIGENVSVIRLMHEFPRISTGKIDRRELVNRSQRGNE